MDQFKDSIIKFCHIKEIVCVIPIIENYLTSINQFNNVKYRNVNFSYEQLFKLDQGNIVNNFNEENLLLWKDEIISKFVKNIELKLKTDYRDNFFIWDQAENKDLLERQLAVFFSNKKLNHTEKQITIEIVDYFVLKGKISYDSRFLLIAWVELQLLKNQELSISHKKSINYSFGFLLKVSIGYFGVSELGFLPTVIIYLGQQMGKDYFLTKIYKFLESILLKNIPIESFDDFRNGFKQFFEISNDEAT